MTEALSSDTCAHYTHWYSWSAGTAGDGPPETPGQTLPIHTGEWSRLAVKNTWTTVCCERWTNGWWRSLNAHTPCSNCYSYEHKRTECQIYPQDPKLKAKCIDMVVKFYTKLKLSGRGDFHPYPPCTDYDEVCGNQLKFSAFHHSNRQNDMRQWVMLQKISGEFRSPRHSVQVAFLSFLEIEFVRVHQGNVRAGYQVGWLNLKNLRCPSDLTWVPIPCQFF